MPSKKRKSSKKLKTFEIFLDVLGYKEDGEWVALALEMDIRGYGKSFDEAIEDLMDLVIMQISFAHFKGEDLIIRPADPVWFQIFVEVRNQKLRAITEGPRESNYEVKGLPIPPPHVIAEISRNFHALNLSPKTEALSSPVELNES